MKKVKSLVLMLAFAGCYTYASAQTAADTNHVEVKKKVSSSRKGRNVTTKTKIKGSGTAAEVAAASNGSAPVVVNPPTPPTTVVVQAPPPPPPAPAETPRPAVTTTTTTTEKVPTQVNTQTKSVHTSKVISSKHIVHKPAAKPVVKKTTTTTTVSQ